MKRMQMWTLKWTMGVTKIAVLVLRKGELKIRNSSYPAYAGSTAGSCPIIIYWNLQCTTTPTRLSKQGQRSRPYTFFMPLLLGFTKYKADSWWQYLQIWKNIFKKGGLPPANAKVKITQQGHNHFFSPGEHNLSTNIGTAPYHVTVLTAEYFHFLFTIPS